MECGSFKVPLDYTGVTPGVLTIPVARIKPTNWTGKSVFFNPGGPGEPAIPFLEGSAGQFFLHMFGHGNAIIAFDPRGCGSTIPYKCPIPNTSYDIDRIGYYDFLHESSADQAAECARRSSRTHSQLIGTSFVARDILALFNVTHEDGLIQYFGGSYGTLLGSNLAAMFPDKIDRMVLDGNLNPRDWHNGLMAEAGADVDAAASYFFDQCSAAGASRCSFAAAANTSAGLRAAYDNISSCIEEQKCLMSTIDG